MSDKRTKDDAKIVKRHEREKQERKPVPLPMRSSSDIFASSEATHLLDRNEETSLLNTIESSVAPSKNAFKETGHKTQILTTAPKAGEDKSDVTSQSNRNENAPESEPSDNTPDGSATQMLDVPSLEVNPLFDSNESTRALTGRFQENEEKTAFFYTQDERAIPKPPEAESHNENRLIDPTPRRSLNQRSSINAEPRYNQSQQAPSPLPRRSGSREPVDPVESRSEPKRANRTASSPPQRSKRRTPKDTESKQQRRGQRKDDTPPKVDPLNVGVFAEDASVVMDDVINQVVEESWKTVPAEKKTITKDTGPQTGGRLTKTQNLWLRIIVGFSVLLAVGFLFRSKPNVERTEEKKRATSIVTPLSKQLPKLGIELPVSDSARKLRPGTDIFILGRQRVLLLIDGVDQSELIHTDSLARTIKNSVGLSAIKQQLSGVQKWPQELALGLDKKMPLAQVQRLSSVLEGLGVVRINLLTDRTAVGRIGELGIDVNLRDSRIPSAGALEMKVESALISIGLTMPQQPTQPLHTLDAFAPSLHQKLDQYVETFSFEHPRIVRAFLRVPQGLRLSQVIELARPLVHDERMRRVTVLPYMPSKEESK